MSENREAATQKKILFLQAPSPLEKITKLLQVASEHEQGLKKILFITSDKASSEYLDKLLWEHPKESFLPHAPQGSKTSAFIYISHEPLFDESITSYFNLTKNPLSLNHFVFKIYEIDESHHPEKKKIFESKYKYYSQQNYHIISL